MNIFKQLYTNLTYNRRKYIKINNKNIYNYLTEEQIMYFDKKYIYFLNDLNILINDSIFSWLIIDKNILVIILGVPSPILYIIIYINNNNTIKFKVYYYNNIVCYYFNNNMIRYDKNTNSRTYYHNGCQILTHGLYYKKIYNKKIKYDIIYNYHKSYIKKMIYHYKTYLFINIFNYINFNIYIKFKINNINFNLINIIKKIKLILI